MTTPAQKRTFDPRPPHCLTCAVKKLKVCQYIRSINIDTEYLPSVKVADPVQVAVVHACSDNLNVFGYQC